MFRKAVQKSDRIGHFFLNIADFTFNICLHFAVCYFALLPAILVFVQKLLLCF